MPLVKIFVMEGKTNEYKCALLDGVHTALVETFKIPDRDRRQMLFELPPGGFGTSEHSTVIELTVFKGRSIEAKRALYKRIVEALSANPGIPGADVLMVVHEPPLENWGIRGGLPASDVDLGFKIDV